MDIVRALYELPLLSKVLEITHKAAGLRDVDLAQYLVSLARDSGSSNDF